ncbi:hypothetical protein [Staphylococcus hominis]|uniref:hypothetical protein n=1 Tax=Staphylococcus hominis TaxID=1290 RepID=UPI000CD2C31D|nr:hypothetical protein [Staphylococcus hominis]MBK1406518.1 hypothetical protein [Staphylococcus hominis]MCI2925099.1 hypothetical protein [Staphylococcus hominis]PNZ84542.1 hypothetical protein CD140_06685 [Staphylococcus hominis subsp. novobiosepticus]
MAKKLDVNKQNIMRAINWIIKNEEEIIFESQNQLSFFSNEDLEKVDYCKRTLESLLEAKEIYNKQKVS